MDHGSLPYEIKMASCLLTFRNGAKNFFFLGGGRTFRT